jgi:phosphoserine phosphatase
MTDDLLPSWHDGETRSALLDFLAAADEIRPEHRLAVFDNDGTLWCEKPRYTQMDFFVWELRHAVQDRPALRAVPEYEALLDGDVHAAEALGLERIALALVALFEFMEPRSFEDRVQAFFDETRHPDSGRRYDQMIYQPMLELLRALESKGFTNAISTGGGTEFVRAISKRVYDIDQERVVGTLVTYVVVHQGDRPVLVRTNRPHEGEANEGEAKIANIQMGLGRRPAFAAGNSPGDAAMLEHTQDKEGPSLALVVNHDDAEREYAYESEAGTFDSQESIVDQATRLGWTQASMLNDWATIFPGSPNQS